MGLQAGEVVYVLGTSDCAQVRMDLLSVLRVLQCTSLGAQIVCPVLQRQMRESTPQMRGQRPYIFGACILAQVQVWVTKASWVVQMRSGIECLRLYVCCRAPGHCQRWCRPR